MIQIHKFENQTNPFINGIQDIFKIKYNFNDNLENLHEILETPLISQEDKEYHKQLHGWKNDRNSIFIKHFHQYVDTEPNFNVIYHQFIKTHIFPLFPNETKLVIQKTPNIRFSFPETAAIGCDPNDPENIIGLHSDSNFGHNENEMNFIIPITKMFSTNSIYYEPTIGSQIEPRDFENLKLETDEFLQAYFNKLRHCNHINKTNKTRISFDIRIIPYSKYMENLDFFNGTKFELGKYYMVIT
jgi:hypothetical protein